MPVRLHWMHSDSPLGTTQRILRSRHAAQAIEALCLTCCLLDCLERWFRGETLSWLEVSLPVSNRDLVSDLGVVMPEEGSELRLNSVSSTTDDVVLMEAEFDVFETRS